MLPTTDDPPPEREPDRMANLSAPENPSYRLPPPRGPDTLQFGTDPFLRQMRGEDVKKTGHQLPPVSHLLTSTTRPNPPPTFHSPTLGSSVRPTLERSHSYQHDHPVSPGQTEYLPPISHAVRSPPDRRHQTLNPVSTAQPNWPSYPGPVLDKGPDPSPSETSSTGSQAQLPPVRPHVVDEKYVDGEGWCYIYADGSYCPKNIDGVPVNANWGVTKAGKPRKRLAQACLTCREKKIKCHPNLPKCDQCQKSGRECRFENA